MKAPPEHTAVAEQDFKSALGHFASGVTIISTLDPSGAFHGMTATSFCSLSLRPPLVLVAIAMGSRCHDLVLAQGRFGVSILADHQVDLSRHFGGKPTPRTAPRFSLIDGVPVLDGAMVTLTCTLREPLKGGDHSIFVGEVTRISAEDGLPLIHFRGQYRTLVPV